MPKAWKHHKDKAEYLTMFWLKFEDDTPKNVVSVSFYLKKNGLRKWTLSITVTRIAHVNKGGYFVFFPYFFVVLD